MAALLSPAPPASARPARTRPAAFIGKTSCSGNLEHELAEALRDITDKPVLGCEGREQKTQASSEVSTAVPSEPSTAAPSQSPSRRGSWARHSIEEEDALRWSPELPHSQGSRSSSCTPQFSRPSLPGESPGWKSSPNACRRARKQFKAVYEEARAVNPISPWLEVKSVAPRRNRELSLPCVEVGYWSVLDFEKNPKKTGRTGQLSTSRQEEVRRIAREMLRAERGSEEERELAAMLEYAKAQPV